MEKEKNEKNSSSFIQKQGFFWMVNVSLLIKVILFEQLAGYGFSSISFLASFGFFLLVTSFLSLFFGNLGRFALLVFDALVSLILFSDHMFYKFYGGFITVPILYQAWQAKGVSESIGQLFHVGYLLYFLDLLFLIPWAFYMKKTKDEKRLKRLWTIAGAGTIVLLLIFLQVRVVNGADTFTNLYSNKALLYKGGIVNYHAVDIIQFANNNKTKTLPAEQLKVWMETHRKSEGNHFQGEMKGKNLIVIQMESLQGFVIGKSINGQEITPNLNRFLKRTLYFDNYFTQIAQGTTSDAEFMTLNSLYPLPTGAAYVLKSQNQYQSLPKMLAEKGYGTYVFHPFDPNYWNRDKMYPSEGIQKFYNANDYVIPKQEIIGLGLSDELSFTQTFEKMKSLKSPYFAFVITLSGHHPYVIPQEKRELTLPKNQYSQLFEDYLQAQHYADKSLGKFLSMLESGGLFQNSLIAIYGDHFGPQLTAGEIRKFLGQKDTKLTDLETSELNKVPLLFHFPNENHVGKMSVTGGQMDFYPTVANLMGLDKQKMFYFGQDLLNAKDGFVVFREFIPEGSAVSDAEFYITNTSGTGGAGTCYNRSTGKPQTFGGCTGVHDLAEWHLNMSDLILNSNALPELVR